MNRDLAPFCLVEREIRSGYAEIAVEGEVDRAVRDSLLTLLEDAIAHRRHVLLDFAGCDFIDASGLAVLVRARCELGSRGRRLLLCGARGQVGRVLSITGLADSGLLVATPPPAHLSAA